VKYESVALALAEVIAVPMLKGDQIPIKRVAAGTLKLR
jgi:hypothetical protein